MGQYKIHHMALYQAYQERENRAVIVQLNTKPEIGVIPIDQSQSSKLKAQSSKLKQATKKLVEQHAYF